MVNSPTDRARVDYWLWCIRAYRTRSLAKQACLAGHVSIGAKKARPATAVTVGAVLTLTTGRGQKIVEVLAIPPTRVSAAQAGAFAHDITPPEPPRATTNPRLAGIRREQGLGRPTKKDRRAIERFRGQLP